MFSRSSRLESVRQYVEHCEFKTGETGAGGVGVSGPVEKPEWGKECKMSSMVREGSNFVGDKGVGVALEEADGLEVVVDVTTGKEVNVEDHAIRSKSNEMSMSPNGSSAGSVLLLT